MKVQILLFMVAVVTVTTALPTENNEIPETKDVDLKPWYPPIAAPWYPYWIPCDDKEKACLDCYTKLKCKKYRSYPKFCTDPEKPYCNKGKCSATPSEECARDDSDEE